MPRPTTAEDLLAASDAGFAHLLAVSDALVADATQGAGGAADPEARVRDVLGHLHAWHVMMLRWYDEGMAGAMPVIPAEGYTWRTLPDLNEEIRLRYLDRALADVRDDLDGTHRRLQEIIRRHTDEELFTKKRYHWTGSTSLGAYFVSATSSHYDWALKELRRSRAHALHT
ncbi:MAG: ClbS/DfsB family four-helix bundle protein [Actinobacteria bacterium]|jgi:hypothetical protein|nr:ClbS/DfsB family four-helix bundle protein [Actinomycetota bacterium]